MGCLHICYCVAAYPLLCLERQFDLSEPDNMGMDKFRVTLLMPEEL